MSQLIPNLFTSYHLTAIEEQAGSIFSGPQKMVLQNKLSQVAAQKVGMIYDPSAPLEFAQNISYLQGQMDIITWLLDTSDTIEQEAATKQQQSQQD